MGKTGLVKLFSSLLFAALLVNSHCINERKTRIIYMGAKSEENVSKHHAMLSNVLGSANAAKEALIYSYGKSFNGFAAKLTDEEAARFSGMEGVVSVMENYKMQLHTTRSWDFMGFTKDNLGSSESDVVVALLDTGIWPESDSFSDKEMGPPPAKWKGICEGVNFTCNNKIIGGRYYNSEKIFDVTDFKSPRDSLGHGTHTASTAAGREVAGASYFNLAKGTARGGVPRARIAVYKVCWSSGCYSADILAAFDDAIADGVDLISVSLGYDFPLPFSKDPIAIGSFHAMRNGILTSNSAGNSGPFPVTVSNFAPWTLTVAASTIDRKFTAQAALGNGQIISGLSVNSFELNGTSYPLIWGGDAANYTIGSNREISSYCYEEAMNSILVKGKIVLCNGLSDGSGILVANGIGTIMTDSMFSDFAFNYPLPATVISPEDGIKVLDYIRSEENPTATIFVGETTKDVMAPIVVSFSSRGPSALSPDILKDYADSRSVNYNIISGTSMSCPHASGAAAYVKGSHPNWSPAAIKSALMTTAYVMDPKKHQDLEFAYGSGHINPEGAVDPGLVFDASETDYINFLCKQGYNTTTLRLITGDSNSTCQSANPGRGWDLNYPSFSLYVQDGEEINGVFPRTVTNVGQPTSTYNCTIQPISGVTVTIEPSILSFSAVGEKQSFTLTVKGPKITQQPIVSGALTCSDGSHSVRAPLVVYNYYPGAPYDLSDSVKTYRETTRKGSSIYHKNWIFGRGN